jgi:hypothetical protein
LIVSLIGQIWLSQFIRVFGFSLGYVFSRRALRGGFQNYPRLS